jgi:SAM-dependent methyltransferase
LHREEIVSSDVRAAWNAYLAREMIGEPLALVDTRPMRVVLDVGSGPESISSSQFQRDTICLSIDVRRSPTVNVLSSALALPFRNEAFDVVLCLRVLQHLRDDARALREMFRVTRKKGVAVIAIGNLRSWTLIKARMANPKWRARIPYAYYHLYDSREIVQKMAEAGFEEVGVRGAIYVPDAINRLPPPFVRAILQHAAVLDHVAGLLPGIRMAGTNLIAWGRKP